MKINRPHRQTNKKKIEQRNKIKFPRLVFSTQTGVDQTNSNKNNTSASNNNQKSSIATFIAHIDLKLQNQMMRQYIVANKVLN